ncbi:TPA: S8 family peptidase [Pseudomonas aeruginosa]|uniref:S8 family peptidase n=1 Tax=Pseudomonas aeruginosa TaxID=287 RepID=UPI0009A350B5|nr:S8 family peptidase [Pseudomonas aeruginosa]EKW7235544.1 S8 family peptidase [Pseudomonas aeruginosa]MBI8707158.1 S8 family peptidase [Pseudomonas aeruginosa]MBI8829061.1 S8 family peptidase [Pseudomonas aeruginosa]MDI4098782.1 S8 family peptidase [Pseudomonas aeruginosa]OXT59335.1 hypothetical protein CF345_29000 [Pseudomonas aeruginosa]
MAERPVLNPVLKLLKSPAPKTVPGGGKNERGIKKGVLANKRKVLSQKVDSIKKSNTENITFSGVMHIIAKMDDDSLSPSWTPTDLFDSKTGSRIIAPAYKGFLIEIEREKLSKLSNALLSSTKTNEMVDISRISNIEAFDERETLRGRKRSETWESLPVDGDTKAANIWLKPFKNILARKDLANRFKAAFVSTKTSFGHPEFDLNTDDQADTLSAILNEYITSGHAAFSLHLKAENDFGKLVSSGAIYRIEAAPSVKAADAPGKGAEPNPSSVSHSSPTVVIIDGGVNAKSYLPLQKLPLKPLIKDSDANLSHGNKVASLVCHAHAWNKNRPLPELDCTFISAQAICKSSVPKTPNHRQLLNYLYQVADQTSNYSKVWNMSFNLVASMDSKEEVSYLGHEISKLARKYNILPVISAGNIDHNPYTKTLCPPADCEASLTISGRDFDVRNNIPGEACKLSLRGPAPAGMKKPDLSWYSKLRMIGGTIHTGTSFAAPLVSSLAAHAFANLKDATPDLIRALLINRAELFAHSDTVGWGTPWIDDHLPWLCTPGDVTIAWTAKLAPGFNYYWNDIPIPPELVDNGKFVGAVALTAVLKPLTSDKLGENYFSSRLQTSLQATSASGKTISLVGSMREDKEKEVKARTELAKWSPVRNHYKAHRGTGITGSTMRLNARIFTRDLYQFDISHHSELPSQDVAFVLTLRSPTGDDSIYESTIQGMQSEVESAVINQEIEVGS